MINKQKKTSSSTNGVEATSILEITRLDKRINNYIFIYYKGALAPQEGKVQVLLIHGEITHRGHLVPAHVFSLGPRKPRLILGSNL